MRDGETAALHLTHGFAAQKAGDTAAAREHFRKALALEPENSEAWHLLGLVEAERDFSEAARLMERAVGLEPGEPLYRANLSSVCEKLGDIKRAAEHLRALLNLDGRDARAWTRLWRLERTLGNAPASARAFRRALTLSRGDAKALHALGERAIKAGDAEAALHAAELLAAHRESEGDAYRIRCGVLARQRRWSDAAKAAGDWARLYPREVLAWRHLSTALFELARFTEAAQAFEPILQIEPERATNYVAYGRLCAFAGKRASARKVLHEAVARHPTSTEANAALANFLMIEGEVREAERLARAAIDADPAAADGYIALADIRPAAITDADLAAMGAVRLAAPEHRVRMKFTISAVFDAKEDFDRAFEALEAANALKREICRVEGHGYDSAEHEAFTARIIGLSARTREETPAARSLAFMPVFVVGMPRSGSTLVESIIAAHPEAHGGGEVAAMPPILMEAMEWCAASSMSFDAAPDDMLAKWRARYLEGYPTHGAPVGTDKQPANHAALGLICAALPEARIIHVRRNPVDTCFSIYQRDFPKAWRYANSLEDLGHYYGEYARRSAYWDRMLGDNYLSVDLEQLIGDFDATARAIVAHCGLDWRDECTKFYEQKRVVSTFSSVQARQPVYAQRSAFSRYGARLAPLIAALEQAGVDPATGRLAVG